MNAPVQGFVATGWEGVKEAFQANLDSGADLGAGVSAFHHGKCVVDLTGGWFDKDKKTEYTSDALQLVFSTTKGITAIAVAMLVQRGVIDYGAPVAQYWPEFAQHGKQDATVAQLLSHQCGLSTVVGKISLQEALDWNTITSRLAATAPSWPIGTKHGYHALTYGWLAGELIRRVDGRSPGRFVAEEIAGPLGVEMFIGLPEQYEPRVSRLSNEPVDPNTPPIDPMVAKMLADLMGPDSPGGRALSLNGAFGEITSTDGVFNTRAVHAAEIPAANGITNARSLATIYAATLGPINGVQLINDSIRECATATITPAGEADECLIMPTTFGMGFMTHGQFTPYAGSGSYGHSGAGGSVAFAQESRQLSLAYVMNQMAANLATDARAQRLTDAAVKCADAAK
ncbi:MAG: class A beta-lactamase-related serine hydrolase [Ilumatobacteraceae bacterium]|nr:class A beta-lactamase-related serine hydrolase [Ilumatobacteraceae bacterium]